MYLQHHLLILMILNNSYKYKYIYIYIYKPVNVKVYITNELNEPIDKLPYSTKRPPYHNTNNITPYPNIVPKKLNTPYNIALFLPTIYVELVAELNYLLSSYSDENDLTILILPNASVAIYVDFAIRS